MIEKTNRKAPKNGKAPAEIVAEKKSHKKWIAALIALLLVALIGGGAVYLQDFFTPKDYELLSAEGMDKEEVFLVAHRGYRAVAPENTLPAFEQAGKAGFRGAECDIYRTADGVWVIQHDFITTWMMDCNKKIEKSTYAELKEHTVNNGVNIDQYPDLKICTLEEYLACCKQYDMVPVIELKSKNNSEYYQEVEDLVKASGVEKVIYISFYENCLKAMRSVSSADLYYLCSELNEEAVKIAQSISDCGIDFDGNNEENYDNNAAVIRKAQNAGLAMGAWTIDDLDTMQKLLDLGVNMITTDNITYAQS